MTQANNFMVFNPSTLRVLRQKNGSEARGLTKRGAARVLVNAIKRGDVQAGEFVVNTSENFNKYDPVVKVKSMMNGASVHIRQSQRGGCCDPSTETYWSM